MREEYNCFVNCEKAKFYMNRFFLSKCAIIFLGSKQPNRSPDGKRSAYPMDTHNTKGITSAVSPLKKSTQKKALSALRASAVTVSKVI